MFGKSNLTAKIEIILFLYKLLEIIQYSRKFRFPKILHYTVMITNTEK